MAPNSGKSVEDYKVALIDVMLSLDYFLRISITYSISILYCLSTYLLPAGCYIVVLFYSEDRKNSF
jgi:hypothetical protein